jgi:hypothetical protein
MVSIIGAIFGFTGSLQTLQAAAAASPGLRRERE